MATEQSEKMDRLHPVLQETVHPTLTKIETLEQEIISLKEE